MEQLNKIQLRGRVGNTRLRTVGDKKVCNFSVATNCFYRNQENLAVEEVTWHNCTLWESKRNPPLESIVTGAPIEVTGRLRSSKYTSTDGTDRVYYEVFVGECRLLPADEVLKSESNI